MSDSNLLTEIERTRDELEAVRKRLIELQHKYLENKGFIIGTASGIDKWAMPLEQYIYKKGNEIFLSTDAAMWNAR